LKPKPPSPQANKISGDLQIIYENIKRVYPRIIYNRRIIPIKIIVKGKQPEIIRIKENIYIYNKRIRNKLIYTSPYPIILSLETSARPRSTAYFSWKRKKELIYINNTCYDPIRTWHEFLVITVGFSLIKENKLNYH
jgi:hypothetical protein